MSKTIDGKKVLDNVSFTVRNSDKIMFLADEEIAKTTLFQILCGELEPDSRRSNIWHNNFKCVFP